MNDRRRQNRTILDEVYRVYERHSGELIGRVVNLSRFGFLTIGDGPVEERRILDVELVYVDEQGWEQRIPMRAETVWCRQSRYSPEYGGGFQIHEITEEDALRIERLVDQPPRAAGLKKES